MKARSHEALTTATATAAMILVPFFHVLCQNVDAVTDVDVPWAFLISSEFKLWQAFKSLQRI